MNRQQSRQDQQLIAFQEYFSTTETALQRRRSKPIAERSPQIAQRSSSTMRGLTPIQIPHSSESQSSQSSKSNTPVRLNLLTQPMKEPLTARSATNRAAHKIQEPQSPSNRRENMIVKKPLTYYERSQWINNQLMNKWMAETRSRQIMEQFFSIYTAFMKLSPKKAMNKILHLVEFNACLKPLFVTDNTSILSFNTEISFDSFCSQAFSMQLYNQYLHDRFSINHLQEFRKLQKALRRNPQDAQLLEQLESLKIPNIQHFVRDILLVELEHLTEQINDYMLKKKSEEINMLGKELEGRRLKVLSLKYQQIKRIQATRNYNPRMVKPIEQLGIGDGYSFQAMSKISLNDDISRVELNYGQLNKVTKTSRHVYNEIYGVLVRLQRKVEP